MDDELIQRSIELIKEIIAGIEHATVSLFVILVSLSELVGTWVFYFLEKTVQWAINTGVPLTRSAVTTAISLAVDVSLISVHVVSVSAVSIFSFLQATVAKRI